MAFAALIPLLSSAVTRAAGAAVLRAGAVRAAAGTAASAVQANAARGAAMAAARLAAGRQAVSAAARVAQARAAAIGTRAGSAARTAAQATKRGAATIHLHVSNAAAQARAAATQAAAVPRQGFGKAATAVFGGGNNATPTASAPSVNQSINQPGNFGRILSGGVTAAQAQGEGQQEAQQEAEKATREKNQQEVSDASKKLAAALLTPGPAAIALNTLLSRFANSLVESNRHLGRYSGTLQHANALLDRGNILRDRASAAATGKSAAGLADAVNEMKDVWRPIGDATSNILNKLGTGAAKMVTLVGKGVNVLVWIAEHIPFVKDIFKDQDVQRPMWDQWVQDMHDKAKARQRPPQGKKP